MTRLLFYTDTHLAGRSPRSRKDNFPQVILTKIKEVYQLAVDQKVDLVLFGGDLFDKHRVYAYEVMAELFEIVEECPIPTRFVVGQHDLIGYNMGTYVSSSLGFVSKLSTKFKPLLEPLELDDCVIHPCHVSDDVYECLDAVEGGEKVQIVLAHALLSKEKAIFDVIQTSDVESENVDLVLSGDLHTGVEWHTVNGTAFYNPGALARTKCTVQALVREVKCGLIEIEATNEEDLFASGEASINLTEIPIEAAMPADEVFAEESVITAGKKKEVEAGGFVEGLEGLEVEATDIFEFLELAATKKNLRRALIDYILSFRDEDDVVRV